MSLPRIDIPTFETTLPSGKEISFRPFTVKEQKALLITAEGGDEKTVFQALVNLVNACTFDKLDWWNRPTVDLEWAFLYIRSKSVGEVVDITFKCLNKIGEKECGTKNELSVDVRTATFDPFPESLIYITPTIAIQLEPLTVWDAKNGGEVNLRDKTKFIMDGEEIISEFTVEEFEEFENSIPPFKHAEIMEFFSKQPQLTLNIPTRCVKCGKEGTITLKGVLNFFG